MRLGEVIACMRVIRKRKLIGRVIRHEVARQGTVEQVADAANMTSPALYQVFNADWSVTSVRLRSLEKTLGLADNLLEYILAGDSERISALSGAELTPRLRGNILAGLARIDAEEAEIVHDYFRAF